MAIFFWHGFGVRAEECGGAGVLKGSGGPATTAQCELGLAGRTRLAGITATLTWVTFPGGCKGIEEQAIGNCSCLSGKGWAHSMVVEVGYGMWP